MALVAKAREECEFVVVSIFVNPLQFGAHEDLDKYPRTLAADIELCRKAGVNAVFHPGVTEMYPQGQRETTKVVPPVDLTERLCGLFRPGHFTGVATVVCKLLSQVEPEKAYFGEKDFQQLAIVKRMVADLDLPVAIVGVPTVREGDGLALSSRNVYLDKEQRPLAPRIYETLCWIRESVRGSGMTISEALELGKSKLASISGVTVQYLEACDPDTLQPVDNRQAPIQLIVAAKFGDVRLIDNLKI
jgi:pantoate--beta-alanine ligase